MNKKKNRSLLCLMLAVLMLSLSACGANDDGADQEDNAEVLQIGRASCRERV